MISLKEFINKTKGTKVSLPGGGQKGQCVSLVQQYIHQCLGQPIKARGHAKSWKTTYVNEGLGKITKSPRYGDIIVYDIGKYGHIAININATKMYDQNNGYHDNYLAGYGNKLKGAIYLRPNVDLIPDNPTIDYISGIYRLTKDKAIRKTHNLGDNKLKVKNCTSLTKNYLTSSKPNEDAYLKKGTEIYCKDIYVDKENRIWGSFGNCWIVLCNKDGTSQATKK